MMRPFQALLLVVCLFAAHAATVQLETQLETMTVGVKYIVTMGYMDEEVAHTLKAVLNNAGKFSKILVLERDIKDNTELFERPLSTYAREHSVNTYDGPRDAWTTTTTGPAQNFGKGAAATLLTEVGTWNKNRKTFVDTEVIPNLLADVKSKTCFQDADNSPFDCMRDSAMSIVEFTATGPNTAPVIIIVRTMEMGMNSAIFHKYNLQTMQIIKKVVGSAKIDFFAIGASGAANRNDRSGCVHWLKASYYVGIVDTETQGTVKRGSGFAESAGKTLNFVKSTSEQRDLATGKKVVKWLDANNKIPFDVQVTPPAVNPVVANMQTLRDASSLSSDNIGFTTGFFQGLNTKFNVNLLGGHAANTEDFHIVHLIQDITANKGGVYPQLGDYAIVRIDADPYPGPDFATKNLGPFNTWLKNNPCVPAGTYKAVGDWKASGMKTEQVPDQLCWAGQMFDLNFFVQGTKTTNGENCVLNPFLVEAASDMDEWAKKQDGCQGGGMGDRLECAAGKLADATTRNAGFRAKTSREAQTSCTDTAVPIWVRGKPNSCKSWDGYDGTMCTAGEPTTRGLFVNTLIKSDGTPMAFNAEGTDRAFYKSSNQPALKMMNDKLFQLGRAETEPVLAPLRRLKGCDISDAPQFRSSRWSGRLAARIQRILSPDA